MTKLKSDMLDPWWAELITFCAVVIVWWFFKTPTMIAGIIFGLLFTSMELEGCTYFGKIVVRSGEGIATAGILIFVCYYVFSICYLLYAHTKDIDARILAGKPVF